MLQIGTRATGIPRNDVTPLRGQFDLYNALRYVTEAYAGIHLDKCMESILMQVYLNLI
jgi:hypothetical protein